MEQTLIHFLTDYGWLAIFLGSFLFGETVILTAAFLSRQGWWTVSTIFYWALLGTILSDSIWFILGRRFSPIWERLNKRKAYLQKIINSLDKLFPGKNFWALLIVKFLYGTRLIFITYLSLNKLKFKIFFFFDLLGTILWLTVMIILGSLAGRPAANLFTDIKRLEIYLSLLLLLIIMVKLINKWLTKKIINK